MFVYMITNNINEKKYVGQTVHTANIRWSQHLHSALKKNTTSVLHKAIRKYGIEAFRFEILENVSDKEKLNSKEIHWIEKLNTHYIVGNGYNMCFGGKSKSGWKEDSEKTKTRIQKIKKPIICTETGQIFPSIVEGAAEMKIAPAALRNVVAGLKSSCKGLHFEYLDSELNAKASKTRALRESVSNKWFYKGRPVICVSTGKEYPSIKAAARAVGCAEINMHKHLKRLRSSCKGLIFQYRDQLGE